MIARLLPLTVLLCAPVFAQLQLLQFDGSTETPVSQLYQLAAAAPGDAVETRFHVRNFGAGAVNINNLSVTGAGFRISSQPSLPYILAPGAFFEFRVVFSPTATGSYSANLLVNTISVTLRGAAVANAVLSNGSIALAAGATIAVGTTEPGTTLTRALTLSNPSSGSITVSSVVVTGTDFRGPTGIDAPLLLAPGQSIPFDVIFQPSVAQPSTGTLKIDQRSFVLSGTGVNPPLPKATIQFDTQSGISSRQAKVSIQLASASRVGGTGTLTMEFKPSLAGVTDDPAIQFLSGPKRAATITISAGDSIAKFGNLTDLAFQTGTTAGTINFTLKLPNDTVQITFAIAPAPVGFDTVSGTRRVNDLDVSLIGFDNTHSASQLSFTFYDRSGKILLPGVLRVDITPDFRRYFDGSTTGGSFLLRATFPVTGDATQVGGVDVEMTNSAGLAKAQRIAFQ
jgi:hypothetical protein